MTTWDNLYNGYDPLADAYAANPNMYTNVAANGSEFNTYQQFVSQLPTDTKFAFTVFFDSIIPIVLIATMLFVFFGPLFNKIRRW